MDFLGVMGGGAGVSGLMNEVQIIERTVIVGIEFQRCVKFLLGVVKLAHFIKDLAILCQRGGLGLLRTNLRNPVERRRRRNPAGHGLDHLVILLLEVERGLIFWISIKHQLDACVGLVIIALALGGPRQRERSAGQPRDGLRRFRLDAGADLLRERDALLKKFCGADGVAALGGGAGGGQLFAEHPGVVLVQHGPLDGVIDGGVVLRAHGGGQHQQGGKSEGKVGGFYHGKIRFV